MVTVTEGGFSLGFSFAGRKIVLICKSRKINGKVIGREQRPLKGFTAKVINEEPLFPNGRNHIRLS
jgi:hypothetical protein